MKYRHSIVPLLALTLLLLSTASLLQAQDTTPPATPAGPAVDVKTKSLFQKIQEGGWVMFPIGICSVATLYLIVDGSLRTSVRRMIPISHENAAKELFRQGDYMGAYQFCKTNKSPFTNVLRIGLSLLGEGKPAVEEAVIGELAKENSKLQTYISYLSVIGVCSPMIGLLGTVTGMINAFQTLGDSGIGDPSKLSSAIGEVLVATASGLFIAIPAFMAFYFLKNRAVACIHRLQDLLTSLFRKMPYDTFSGLHIGDEEIFAGTPNWASQPSAAPQPFGV
jgi:biopolymer transport protein ExbB